MQMGGFFGRRRCLGVIGDKVGRIQLLFGSILLYSIGNILNGFVGRWATSAVSASSTNTHCCASFAGFGLAGEIGGGITLVSELLPRNSRGFGTTIVVATGVAGAVVGAWSTSSSAGAMRISPAACSGCFCLRCACRSPNPVCSRRCSDRADVGPRQFLHAVSTIGIASNAI